MRYDAESMFDLVADVEAYPDFVPLCQSLKVRTRTTDNGQETLVAVMTVAYKFLRETFTTRVVLDRAALAIHVSYLDGPFRHLQNDWRFEPISDSASKVHFSIDYEFRSRAFGALMGAVFDRAFRKFAEAFEARADVVYGGSGGVTLPV